MSLWSTLVVSIYACRRPRRQAHGSGGRFPDLANMCTLPAWTRSLSFLPAEIIPRIFRIMKLTHDRPPLAGDGPCPVRAGFGLALGF
jgi:hypothetical protein